MWFQRRLFRTKVCTLVELSSIEGKAFVACLASAREREAWVQKDDHFYCDLDAEVVCPDSLAELQVLNPLSFTSCGKFHVGLRHAALQEDQLLQGYHKLRGLDLFAGKLLEQ